MSPLEIDMTDCTELVENSSDDSYVVASLRSMEHNPEMESQILLDERNEDYVTDGSSPLETNIHQARRKEMIRNCFEDTTSLLQDHSKFNNVVASMKNIEYDPEENSHTYLGTPMETVDLRDINVKLETNIKLSPEKIGEIYHNQISRSLDKKCVDDDEITGDISGGNGMDVVCIGSDGQERSDEHSISTRVVAPIAASTEGIAQISLEDSPAKKLCQPVFVALKKLELPTSALVSNKKRQLEYACSWPDCDMQFRRRDRLEQHERVHTGERPFACATCGATYARAEHLRRHRRNSHGAPRPEQRPAVCGECNAQFASADGLRKHAKQFHEDAREACSRCPASFRKKTQLNLHRQREHGEDRWHVCDHPGCSFKAVAANKLSSHKRTHESGRFPCHLCDRVFDGFHQRRKHIATDHRPKCAKCGKVFAHLKLLRDHLRTHDATRLHHTCVLCGHETFSQRTLKEHMTTKHTEGKQEWPCGQCDRVLRTKQKLAQHERALHGAAARPERSGGPRAPRRDKGVCRTDFRAWLSGYDVGEAMSGDEAREDVVVGTLKDLQRAAIY